MKPPIGYDLNAALLEGLGNALIYEVSCVYGPLGARTTLAVSGWLTDVVLA